MPYRRKGNTAGSGGNIESRSGRKRRRAVSVFKINSEPVYFAGGEGDLCIINSPENTFYAGRHHGRQREGALQEP